MRIQLESPKNSGRTSHRPPERARLPERARQVDEEDVLVEDIIMAAADLRDDDDDDDDEELMTNEDDNDDDDDDILGEEERRSLAELGVTTSEELVRRLKSREEASDNSIAKIDIANAAFHDTTIRIPKKHKLIAEWALECICKGTKDLEGDIKEDGIMLFELSTPSKRGNLNTHALYWSLIILCSSALHDTSDMAQIANKYSLSHMLLSFFLVCNAVRWRGTKQLQPFFDQASKLRTSRQILGIDTLHKCLAIALTNLYSGLENADEDEDIERMMRCLRNPELIDMLRLLIKLWSNEIARAGNAERARQFFLTNLLYLFATIYLETCQALRQCPEEYHDRLEQLLELLKQISYNSLFEKGAVNSEYCKIILDRISFFDSNVHPICSLFLAQMGERLFNEKKRKRDAIESSIEVKAEMRKMLLQNFIVPVNNMVAIVDDIADGDARTAKILEERILCLRESLKCIDKYKLYQTSANAEMWSNVLHQMAKYAITVIKNTTYMVDDEEARLPSYLLLYEIHELDDTILQGKLVEGVIASALDILTKVDDNEDDDEFGKATRETNLVEALFKTANKQRRVPELVSSCFSALEEYLEIAYLRQSSHLTGLFDSILHDSQMCKQIIGVAIQDYLGPQQSVDILDMISNKLVVINESYVSTLDRPLHSIERENNIRALALAALQMHFASQIIQYLSFTDTHVQATVETIHRRVATDCLKVLLPKTKAEIAPVEEELIVSALNMLESIQDLCSSSAMKAGRLESNSWNEFAYSLDGRISDLQQDFITLCTRKDLGLSKLQCQIHLSIIKAVERGAQRSKSSFFQTILESKDCIFGLLLRESALAGWSSTGTSSYEDTFAQEDEEENFLLLWREIASRHLPIIEQYASDQLIEKMANIAIQIIKIESKKQDRIGPLTSNANNLELSRWRRAICSRLLKKLTKSERDGSKEGIELVRVISQFPIDWYPIEFLQQAWPKLLVYLSNNDMQSGSLLSHFLLNCIERRSDIIKPSLDSFRKYLLVFLIREAEDSTEEHGQNLTALLKSYIQHSLTSQDDKIIEQQIKKLCDILDEKKWRQKLPVWHLNQGTGHNWTSDHLAVYYRPCSMIIEWRAFILDQIGELLGKLSDAEARAKSGSCVITFIRSHITQNDEHLQILDVEGSAFWKTSGAYEPLIALLSLYRAALKLLLQCQQEYGKEERELDYRTLLDAALTIFSNDRLIQDEDFTNPVIKRKAYHQIAFALLEAKEAGIEIGSLRGRITLLSQPGFGLKVMSSISFDIIFHTWLNFFTVILCACKDQMDADLHYDGVNDALPAFASLCRSSTAKEYEDTLELMISVLSLPGDCETNELFSEDYRKSSYRNCICESGQILSTIISILLCNGPENSLVVSQRNFTRALACMSMWITDEERLNEARGYDPVRIYERSCIGSVQMIEAVLISRPILVRSGDVATIFLTASHVIQTNCSRQLGRALETKVVYKPIITSLIELIRLRKDYVALYLPQLTMLLKQILGIFHSRYIGSYEEHIIDEECEREFINISTLGLEEARQFSRLLSSLTSKSTSSGNSGLPASKIKSLAKPFSSHAIHVIVAFIREMTTLNVEDPDKDPHRKVITFVKGEAREELKRGIYHLCDIVGSWQKNVMMDMLNDDGEKILMRSLWRDWEVQRYKGA